MTDIRAMRRRLGLSISDLARVMRMKKSRTLRAWEDGEQEITGPASLIVEMLDAGELPARYLEIDS